MKTKEELRDGCSKLLIKLRTKNNLSITKMAELVGVDNHTWKRYEDGLSYPTLPDFISYFDALGENAFRYVLDFLYPDIYEGLPNNTNKYGLRTTLMHYIEHMAADRSIEEVNFIVFGNHGSNVFSQLEMFTMLNHLPMEYKVIVASLIDHLYDVAKCKGELINTDYIMPNVEVFRDGLLKGKEAAIEGRNSYTTSSHEK